MHPFWPDTMPAAATPPAAVCGVSLAVAAVVAVCFLPASAGAAGGWGGPPPWEAAGLSEREAAAFLLERWTYGPRGGEVERVLEMGLWNWIEGQLTGDLPGAVAETALSRLEALSWSHRQIVRRYLPPQLILEEALEDEVISRADYSGRNGAGPQRAAAAELRRYTAASGFLPVTGLQGQLSAQKLYRAVYSESQLVEVLTDFWFNHFNVSTHSHESVVHILAYERDAIRPHVLASFRELLGATARHPAMLFYLDNADSVAAQDATTSFDRLMQMELDRFSPAGNPSYRRSLARALGWHSPLVKLLQARPKGLNENYARELLELHTLGVDGGYSQHDVVEAARTLTGWTTFPPGVARRRLERWLADAEAARELGLLADQEFLFRPDYHDSDEKLVLGLRFPAGGAHEEGEALLDLLARHPSTAWHLSYKLAARFAADDPPHALVERLSRTYELTEGDLREMMRTLVRSPELWETRRAKVKSPFALAVSALRALDAEVFDAAPVVDRVRRMGEPLYAYAAPTGFPDRASTWTGVGAMLERLNFAFDLAAGRVPGVGFDLLELAGSPLPETRQEVFEAFFPALLPQRDPRHTLAWIGDDGEDAPDEPPQLEDPRTREKRLRELAAYAVGMLLASPEFQVR